MIITWIIIPNVRETTHYLSKMGFVSIGLAILFMVTMLELCGQLPGNWPAIWLLLAVGPLALVIVVWLIDLLGLSANVGDGVARKHLTANNYARYMGMHCA